MFSHLDRRRRDANTPSHAFRDMLVRILHLHRMNQRAIDVASIIFTQSETGESGATNGQVLAILEVLLPSDLELARQG